MEYKKKVIIWKDNNEPPKNYVWVKSDGNAYEFNHTSRQWEKIMSSNGSDSGNSDSGGGGSDADINQELTFLNQVTNLIYQTQGFMFDADGNKYYADSISNYEDSWSEGTTILGDKETADYVIWVNDESGENTYTVFLTEEEYNYLVNTVDVEREYFRDWTKNKFAFPINSYLTYSGGNFYIQDGVYSGYGDVIPNLFWYIEGSLIYGLKEENINILGVEFSQDDWDDMFETPDTKFTFNTPSEGVYSGFVFADYSKLNNNETIRTGLNNMPQQIYKAGETDFDEIYLVKLTSGDGNFYTIYVKSKTNDWV